MTTGMVIDVPPELQMCSETLAEELSVAALEVPGKPGFQAGKVA